MLATLEMDEDSLKARVLKGHMVALSERQRAHRNSRCPLLVISLLGKARRGKELNGTPASQHDFSRRAAYRIA